METSVVSTSKRVISDKSVQAQAIMEAAKSKVKTPDVAKATEEPKELPKAVSDLKAQFEALTPEQKKALLKEVKGDAKAKTMTRMDAVCQSLKDRKPKTIQEWVKATNETLGNENNQESLFNIRYAVKVLTNFGIECPTK